MDAKRDDHTKRVRELNDALRTTFAGGKVMMTASVDQASVDALLSAPSVGRHYNENFRSRPGGVHGPFDCRDHPLPRY